MKGDNLKSITLRTPWNGTLTLTTQWFLGWKVSEGPSPTPPRDWRMPASVSVSSGLSAYQSALSAAQASGPSKSRPSFVVPAGQTEFVEWSFSESGSLILSWLGMSSSVVTVTKNGVDMGFSPAFPATSTVDGNNGAGGRRQAMEFSVSSGDVVRLSVEAGSASRTVEPLLHKKPASGPWDAHIVMGASREDQGLGSKNLEAAVMAKNPGSDPIVMNYALSGALSNAIAGLSAVAGPYYRGVACYAIIPGNVAGNNVTSGRPYTAAQKAAIDADIDTIVSNFEGYKIVISNMSYRSYSDVSPDNQQNGSLPYNDSIIHPAVLRHSADYYDSSLSRSRIDEYVAILAARAALSDATHGAAAAQREAWVNSHFAFVYSGNWSGIVSPIEKGVALAESTALDKANALINYNEASYALLSVADSPAKSIYSGRMADIYPYVLFSEAVRLIDVAVNSSTQSDKTSAQNALNSAVSAGYSGGSSPNTVAEQQARIDSITVVSFDQVIQIGHGAATAVSGWNRTASTATGVIIADLLDDAGASTGVGLSVSNAPSGVNANSGLVSTIPEIPSAILAATWTDLNNAIEFTIGGLDNSRLYDVVLMPSRQTTQASTTRYTVQGVVRSPEISPVNNVTTTLVVSGIQPDSSGNITVNAARGTGSSYAYHTVTIIRRHSN